MVMSKLHIICGNCGNNNDFDLSIEKDARDITITEPEFEDAVYLTCNNCGTIHDLTEICYK